MCQRDNNPTIEKTTAEGHQMYICLIKIKKNDSDESCCVLK